MRLPKSLAAMALLLLVAVSYPIQVKTAEDFANEIARIVNLSMALGYKLEDEGRIQSREEAYQQISHSASLFKAVLRYVEGNKAAR